MNARKLGLENAASLYALAIVKFVSQLMTYKIYIAM